MPRHALYREENPITGDAVYSDHRLIFCRGNVRCHEGLDSLVVCTRNSLVAAGAMDLWHPHREQICGNGDCMEEELKNTKPVNGAHLWRARCGSTGGWIEGVKEKHLS